MSKYVTVVMFDSNHEQVCYLYLNQVKNWPTGPKGLLYDREWMIVSEQGVCMSQKQVPTMALLQPHVDLNTGTLTLTKKGECNF